MWKDKIRRVLDDSEFVRKRRQTRGARELAAWREAGRRGSPPHILKAMRVREVSRRYGCRTLIETGTCLGEMIVATLGDFERIYSIELSAHLAARARDRLIRYRHVTIRQGDSGEVLPELLNSVQAPALIWLDAHYSGGVTARGILDSPISHELAAIAKHPGHCILIDDAHAFVGEGGYPTLEETRVVAARHFPTYDFTVVDNIIEILPPEGSVALLTRSPVSTAGNAA
jgi:hypothetical protein